MKLLYLLSVSASMALCQEEVMIFNRQVAPPGTTMEKSITVFADGPQKTIKNAPYMADSVTESVQTLADGNRITNTNKSSFARDSEGRTRRENTIQNLGAIGSTSSPISSVFIDDPVAGVTYSLDPQAKVAFKRSGRIFEVKNDQEVGATITAQINRRINQTIETRIEKKLDGRVRDQVIIERRLEGPVASGNKNNLRKEELGDRSIEGVTARGTRTTMTIPAGQAGNERPIEVVTESWYSDEIKAMVLNIHSDPRIGTVTTRLSNLRLAEPSKSLFEPPVGYRLEQGGNFLPKLDTVTIREEI